MLTVEIESMAYGGAGIARVEGKVVFVAGAIEGDTAEVRITRDKKSFAKAELIRILSPSPFRQPSPCQVSDRCGGCPFIEAAPSRQRLWKKDFAVSSLAKLTGLGGEQLADLVGDVRGGAAIGYRHRVTLKAGLQEANSAAQGPVLTLGFLGRRSHSIVAIPTCPVATPAIQQVIEACAVAASVANAAAKDAAAPKAAKVQSKPKKYRRGQKRAPQHSGGYDIQLQQVEGPDQSPKVIATFMTGDRPLTLRALLRRAPELKPLVAALAASPLVSWHGTTKESETAPIFAFDRSESEQAGGDFRYLTFPGLFQQAHLGTNRQMRAFVRDALAGCENVLDLFCGSGNLSLGLSAKKVTGIEGMPRSIAAAQSAADEKAAANSSPVYSYRAAAASDFLSEQINVQNRSREQGRNALFDGIVSDPPRAGHGPLIDQLIALKSPRLVLVGCDPMNLARDVAACLKGGYELNALRIFDAFPHTSHVETIAVLNLPSS